MKKMAGRIKPAFCVLITLLIFLGFFEIAKAENSNPYEMLQERYKNDMDFRFFVNLGIGAVVIVALFMVFGSFLGIELKTSFLTPLILLGIMVILFLGFIHYSGRSAQAIDPPIWLK